MSLLGGICLSLNGNVVSTAYIKGCHRQQFLSSNGTLEEETSDARAITDPGGQKLQLHFPKMRGGSLTRSFLVLTHWANALGGLTIVLFHIQSNLAQCTVIKIE